MKENKNNKAKYWGMILYPESAPKNWKDILTKTGCEIAISPLHDMDSDEETGELKKAHWHLIIKYPNSTTYNNVLTLCNELNAPIPQSIGNIKGAFRYFTHQDNPEKFQYKFDDIVYLNGFDVGSCNKLGSTEIYQIKHDINEFLKENHLYDYTDIMSILFEQNYDWYVVFVDNTILFREICNSIFKKERRNGCLGGDVCDK